MSCACGNSLRELCALQVRKLDKVGYDLRKATGDDITVEEYAKQHGQVPTQTPTEHGRTEVISVGSLSR